MDPQSPALSLEQVIQLQTLTQDLAALLRAALETPLRAAGPLFRIRRVLGAHVQGGGGETVPSAAQNLADLRSLFERVAPKPFGVRTELPDTLEPPSTDLVLQPWQYARTVANREIQVICPFRWILSYPASYSVRVLWPLLAKPDNLDPASLRSYIVTTCMMFLLFAKRPELKDLFAAMRFEVRSETIPRFGDLPFVTVSAPVRSVCPNDTVVLHAATLSASHSFQEVVDLDSIRALRDPLRAQMEGALAAHAVTL